MMRADVRKGGREETIPVTKKTEELFPVFGNPFRCTDMGKHAPLLVLVGWMFIAVIDMLTHGNPLVNFLFVLGCPVFFISLGLSIWKQMREP